MVWLPKRTLPWPGAIWLKYATLGLPGGLDRAKPIISATATGYTMSSPTSSGERRRIWRSLTSSHRTMRLLVPTLVEETNERGLQVAGASHGLIKTLWRAREQQLAVH